MLTLAIWIALAVALAAVLAAILRAAAAANEDESNRAESLGFLRLLLTGVFGVVIGQGLTPIDLAWGFTALISIVLMFALLFGSQWLAKRFGHRPFGQTLLRIFKPAVNSWHLLFTPLSLPKEEEPEEFEQELLDSVEEFGDTIVREIMVPRVDMATVSASSTLADAMTVLLARGYSRVPVRGKSIDDIVGVLYLKDTARAMHERQDTFKTTSVTEIMRPVLFVPESLAVEDLLQQMQTTNRHIAIVVDEYGGVAGLVTLEDVIEELVGEITDEYDNGPAEVEQLSENNWRVNARFPLIDLGELFDIELEDEDVDSVGGLLSKELGRLPAKGDSVSYSGLEFTAERIEGRRKRLVSVLVSRQSDLADAQAAFGVEA